MAEAKEIIAIKGVSYLNILPSSSLAIDSLIDERAYPTAVFLDGNGDILATYVGMRSETQWRTIIDPLLAAQ